MGDEMTAEQQTYLLIKGAIADLEPDDQKRVAEALQRPRDVMAEYPGGHAVMAMALLGAEIQR